MFSQNMHHLSPKGSTLPRRGSQNEHPTLYSCWHPGSASQYPDFLRDHVSCSGLTGAAPSSHRYLIGTQRAEPAGRPRSVTATPHLLVAPRSPLASRVSAAQPLLPCIVSALGLAGRGLTAQFRPEEPGSPASTPQHQAASVGPPHPTLSVHTPPPTDAESRF